MRDEANRARRKRPEIMIHYMEVQTLKVWDVSRDVDRENLTLPLIGSLGACAIPLDHDAALGWPITLFDNRGIGRKLLDVDRQSPDRLDVVAFQIGVIPQFADHGVEMCHGQIS